jgi:hypothetical protein
MIGDEDAMVPRFQYRGLVVYIGDEAVRDLGAGKLSSGLTIDAEAGCEDTIVGSGYTQTPDENLSP